MRIIGATLIALAIVAISTGAQAQHVTGHLIATSPMATGLVASLNFECTGNDPCVGSMRGTIRDHGCSNEGAFSGALSATGGMLPSPPGPVSVTVTAPNADLNSTLQPDGTCVYSTRNKDFVQSLAGRWDGQQGTLSGTHVDNDGFVVNIVATYTADVGAPFTMAVDSSVTGPIANATASVQFASNLVGTTQSVYVFALAPPAIVKSAPGA